MFFNIAHSYYDDKYFNNNDETAKKNYDDFKDALENENWQYVVNYELAQAKMEYEQTKSLLSDNTINDKTKKEYEYQLFSIEQKIDTLEYRLEENVNYGSNYLNDAIDVVNNNAYDVAIYNNSQDEKEKKQYEDSVKSYYESKYILDEKVDTNNEQSLRAIFINFFSEYFFLTLVFVVMIAGGLVSDEFNKGTIKSLLITPYKRIKILMAKFITALLMIPIFVIFALLAQFIVGSIVFGVSSLSIPVVFYNLTTSSLETLSLFKYIIIQFVVFLPEIILLATLAFAASAIINNTAFAIAITFCGYIGSELINSFALIYDIKFLNYFVTTNWNFSSYLFGGTSEFGNSLPHAIIVCLIYFAIMVVTSLIVFNKKDIKNI